MNKLKVFQLHERTGAWYRRYSLIRSGLYAPTNDLDDANVIASPVPRPPKGDYILHYSDLWSNDNEIISKAKVVIACRPVLYKEALKHNSNVILSHNGTWVDSGPITDRSGPYLFPYFNTDKRVVDGLYNDTLITERPRLGLRSMKYLYKLADREWSKYIPTNEWYKYKAVILQSKDTDFCRAQDNLKYYDGLANGLPMILYNHNTSFTSADDFVFDKGDKIEWPTLDYVEWFRKTYNWKAIFEWELSQLQKEYLYMVLSSLDDKWAQDKINIAFDRLSNIIATTKQETTEQPFFVIDYKGDLSDPIQCKQKPIRPEAIWATNLIDNTVANVGVICSSGTIIWNSSCLYTTDTDCYTFCEQTYQYFQDCNADYFRCCYLGKIDCYCGCLWTGNNTEWQCRQTVNQCCIMERNCNINKLWSCYSETSGDEQEEYKAALDDWIQCTTFPLPYNCFSVRCWSNVDVCKLEIASVYHCVGNCYKLCECGCGYYHSSGSQITNNYICEQNQAGVDWRFGVYYYGNEKPVCCYGPLSCVAIGSRLTTVCIYYIYNSTKNVANSCWCVKQVVLSR